MQRKKHRYVVDPAISRPKAFPQSKKKAVLLALEDVNLPASASDKQILSKCQKINALVLTADTGSGFSKSIIFRPDYNSTGVVLVPQSYDVEEQDEAITHLASSVPFEALIHARTAVDIEKAKIAKAGSPVKTIYFKDRKG